MKTVAVLVNDEDKQYEGLRSSLGMMLIKKSPTWMRPIAITWNF
jgi:hypothetical protein